MLVGIRAAPPANATVTSSHATASSPRSAIVRRAWRAARRSRAAVARASPAVLGRTRPHRHDFDPPAVFVLAARDVRRLAGARVAAAGLVAARVDGLRVVVTRLATAGLLARLAVVRFAVARLAGARFAGVVRVAAVGERFVVLLPAFAALAVDDAPRALLAAAPLRAPVVFPDLVAFDAEPEAPSFDVPFLPELLREREPEVGSPEVLERVAM